MNIVNSVFQKIVKTTYAASINPVSQVMCYYTVPTTPKVPNSFSDILFNVSIALENTLAQIITLILSPLSAIYFSIISSLNLAKRASFSALYAIYKAFIRIIFLSLIFSAISFLVLIVKDNFDFNLWTYFSLFIIEFIIICLSTSLGYFLMFFKSRKLIGVSFALTFFIPALLIFLVILLLDFVPALNKFLPKDAQTFKKSKLLNRLIAEGKLPKNTKNSL